MRARQNSIFRDTAIKHYTQQKKRDILPNFSSIPVAIFLWMLLGSLLATGLVTWHTQVPIYLSGTGIVLGSAAQDTVALALLAPTPSTSLHAGLTVHIQTGATGSQFTSQLAAVEPGTTTLAGAFAHARLPVAQTAEMQQPVIIILITENPAVVLEQRSVLLLRVIVGTHSLFSAISGIGR